MVALQGGGCGIRASWADTLTRSGCLRNGRARPRYDRSERDLPHTTNEASVLSAAVQARTTSRWGTCAVDRDRAL